MLILLGLLLQEAVPIQNGILQLIMVAKHINSNLLQMFGVNLIGF